MWRAWIGLLAAGIGCSGGDDDPTPIDTDDGSTGGACGDYLETDVEIVGHVESRSGAPVEGADVWLEERNWAPGTIHGSATSDASGNYSFFARDLPIIEGCWGTAVSFYLAGEIEGFSGDKPMNPPIINAWNDGSLTVDATVFPLVLDPIE